MQARQSHLKHAPGRAPHAARLLPALALLAACSNIGTPAGELQVGAGRREITPTPETAPPAGSVYLGGYGLGPERPSTGVLAPIYVRAFVVSGPEGTLAFAQNETQGAFAAYRSGPFGLRDVARAVEEATGGAIPRSHVIVGSDHSHAGPDTTGVWGGLPESYLAFVRDQTVGAIVDAFQARRPASLWTGAVDASDLVRSQFDLPPNDVVDGELRVLLASAPGDPQRPIAAMINYAAHATVMGSGNTLISGDWPSVVAAGVEAALGIESAVVMVADVGRTQPERGAGGGATDPERLEAYGTLVLERALAALAAPVAVAGTDVAAEQRFLREPYGNPLFPLDFLGSIISRADTPPWLEDGQVGTVVTTARIGEVFFAAVPGEGYPAIQLAMQERVAAAQHFVFGLANDQLGYLISPEEGYPEVLAAAPDNDNAVFNVSPKIGDHVECSLLAAATTLGLDVTPDSTRCGRWAGEDPRLPGEPTS